MGCLNGAFQLYDHGGSTLDLSVVLLLFALAITLFIVLRALCALVSSHLMHVGRNELS